MPLNARKIVVDGTGRIGRAVFLSYLYGKFGKLFAELNLISTQENVVWHGISWKHGIPFVCPLVEQPQTLLSVIFSINPCLYCLMLSSSSNLNRFLARLSLAPSGQHFAMIQIIQIKCEVKNSPYYRAVATEWEVVKFMVIRRHGKHKVGGFGGVPPPGKFWILGLQR